MEVMHGEAIDTLSSRTLLDAPHLDPHCIHLARAIRFVSMRRPGWSALPQANVHE
jgi:hypothetical protein